MNWDWLTDQTKSKPIPLPKDIDWLEFKRRLRDLPLAIAKERIISFCAHSGIDMFYNDNETIGHSFKVSLIQAIDLIESYND